MDDQISSTLQEIKWGWDIDDLSDAHEMINYKEELINIEQKKNEVKR